MWWNSFCKEQNFRWGSSMKSFHWKLLICQAEQLCRLLTSKWRLSVSGAKMKLLHLFIVIIRMSSEWTQNQFSHRQICPIRRAHCLNLTLISGLVALCSIKTGDLSQLYSWSLEKLGAIIRNGLLDITKTQCYSCSLKQIAVASLKWGRMRFDAERCRVGISMITKSQKLITKRFKDLDW